MDKELISKVRDWLKREKLFEFFKELKKEFGHVSPVLSSEHKLNTAAIGIPHPVHFREGMAVRNFLRQHVDWDDHKLDNKWAEIVEKVIKEDM